MHSGYGTRLLSIGEIFDRAVHLTIANLLPLAVIVGLVALPAHAIADWVERDELSRYFVTVGKIVADPRMFANFGVLIQGPHLLNPWIAVLWNLVTLFPVSLATAAASIATQELLKGEKPSFGRAYLSAIRRVAPVTGACMLIIAILAADLVAALIVMLLLWLVTLVVGAAGGPALSRSNVSDFLTLSIPLFAVIVIWTSPLMNCTSVGAALYARKPLQAIREAWTMTMSRGLRGRSLALGTAFVAFTVVQEFVRSAVCGVLSILTHSTWFSFIARDSISFLALIFWTVLAVVFYLDARNRTGLIQDPLAERENA